MFATKEDRKIFIQNVLNEIYQYSLEKFKENFSTKQKYYNFFIEETQDSFIELNSFLFTMLENALKSKNGELLIKALISFTMSIEKEFNIQEAKKLEKTTSPIVQEEKKSALDSLLSKVQSGKDVLSNLIEKTSNKDEVEKTPFEVSLDNSGKSLLDKILNKDSEEENEHLNITNYIKEESIELQEEVSTIQEENTSIIEETPSIEASATDANEGYNSSIEESEEIIIKEDYSESFLKEDQKLDPIEATIDDVYEEDHVYEEDEFHYDSVEIIEQPEEEEIDYGEEEEIDYGSIEEPTTIQTEEIVNNIDSLESIFESRVEVEDIAEINYQEESIAIIEEIVNTNHKEVIEEVSLDSILNDFEDNKEETLPFEKIQEEVIATEEPNIVNSGIEDLFPERDKFDDLRPKENKSFLDSEEVKEEIVEKIEPHIEEKEEDLTMDNLLNENIVKKNKFVESPDIIKVKVEEPSSVIDLLFGNPNDVEEKTEVDQIFTKNSNRLLTPKEVMEYIYKLEREVMNLKSRLNRIENQNT